MSTADLTAEEALKQFQSYVRTFTRAAERAQSDGDHRGYDFFRGKASAYRVAALRLRRVVATELRNSQDVAADPEDPEQVAARERAEHPVCVVTIGPSVTSSVGLLDRLIEHAYTEVTKLVDAGCTREDAERAVVQSYRDAVEDGRRVSIEEAAKRDWS